MRCRRGSFHARGAGLRLWRMGVALAMAAALAIALRYSTLLAMVAGCAAVVILRNAFGI